MEFPGFPDFGLCVTEGQADSQGHECNSQSCSENAPEF